MCELIERYPAHQLPDTGGVSATMVVLIDVDTLLGRLEKAGVLDTGEKISPALARRLACEAGLIPVVLDGESQPIDVGRSQRLFTVYQRVVMLARDKGCKVEGCDRTTGLHAHHQTPLDRRRPHRPGQRHPALRLAPPTRPRHPIPDDLPPQRRRHLPPTNPGGRASSAEARWRREWNHPLALSGA